MTTTTSESRDTLSSVESQPSPSTQRRLGSPHLNPSPQLRFHNTAAMNHRARAKSLGAEPLLMPQSPLSSFRHIPLSPRLNSAGASPSTSASSLKEPPRISETQKMVEHAVQEERKRSKEMEKDELNMSADELRAVLKQERRRMSTFAADLARLKSAAVQCQAESEIHEERCINGLMRRLDSLQAEKGRLVIELEREEEMLTNTLQKKLNQVRNEKAALEKKIENEKREHKELERKVAYLQGKGGVDTQSKGEDSKNDEVATTQGPATGLGSLTEIPGEEGGDDDEEEWQHGDAPIPR
eukprot:scaffold2186_cov113-Cylindrotheca_fusiformis.AAC.6